jgi:hypothetical protein
VKPTSVPAVATRVADWPGPSADLEAVSVRRHPLSGCGGRRAVEAGPCARRGLVLAVAEAADPAMASVAIAAPAVTERTARFRLNPVTDISPLDIGVTLCRELRYPSLIIFNLRFHTPGPRPGVYLEKVAVFAAVPNEKDPGREDATRLDITMFATGMPMRPASLHATRTVGVRFLVTAGALAPSRLTRPGSPVWRVRYARTQPLPGRRAITLGVEPPGRRPPGNARGSGAGACCRRRAQRRSSARRR